MRSSEVLWSVIVSSLTTCVVAAPTDATADHKYPPPPLWSWPWGTPYPKPQTPRPQGPKSYALTQNYVPSNIMNEFKFMSAADFTGMINRPDPSRGFVNYLDQQTAVKQGLAKVTRNNQFFLGVDNSTIIVSNSTISNSTTIGRSSVRLESKKTWSSGLLIADFEHMPGEQCGVWPAFWNYNMQENPIGEIDIIEGLNFQDNNLVTLHTGNNCTFLPGWQTGTDQRTNCADPGCGITAPSNDSYGDGFNAAKGGVYATLVDNSSIKVWHWPRKHVPLDITFGMPRPQLWGEPLLDMSKWHGGCDPAKNFHTMTIILNIDFCGSNMPQTAWDANVRCNMYPTCNDFVANHPEAFHDTYWLVNSIKVYEKR